jgi:hypothetical protein
VTAFVTIVAPSRECRHSPSFCITAPPPVGAPGLRRAAKDIARMSGVTAFVTAQIDFGFAEFARFVLMT